MTLWIKNSEGKPDAVLTVTVIGFLVVLVKLVLSGVSVSVGEVSYAFGTIESDMIAAILTPTLGTYAARRYTDRRYPTPAPVTYDEPEIEIDYGNENDRT